MKIVAVVGFISVIAGLALAATPAAEEPFPRVPPTPAADAIKSFQLHEGLRIELVASEPMIESPVGISFDEDGRLYVVEMRDYPDRPEQAMGRIKLLEDTRGDGHYDKATIFAEHLPWPTSVFCSGGGVFATMSPDILWLKDTHGSGQADQRSVAFTGFGVTTNPLNVQGLVNNLNWSLDDRIEGTPSFNGGLVSRPGGQDKPLDLRGRDFSFDPRDLSLRPENGGGQHGLSFDAFGRKFVCMNSKPVETFMYDARYAARNSLYAMPPSLVEVDSNGPDVYRISPEEAWRVLRTKLRVAGQVEGPIENGGRSAGYYTGVSGITIYTGDALPEEFRGNAFIGEVANNVVVRQVISPDGVGVIARRAPEEQKSEFLASRDIWFRPVQFANGPDGALYVIDMYRECIEHPWSLPDEIKRRLDLHSGFDRGRIWRIVPEGFVRAKTPKLSKATTAELVALLDHPNGWQRDTAARLLFERQDSAAVPLLEKFLSESKTAIGRVRAICALEGQGALKPSHVLTAVGDPDPRVRQRGVLLSERLLGSADCPAELWIKLIELADDPEISVRYQLAFSLGESHNPARIEPLSRIVARDIDNPWIRAAVISSSAGEEAELFARLSRSSGDSAAPFLIQLAQLIGRSRSDAGVTQVINVIADSADQSDPRQAFELARALKDGLRRAGGANAYARQLDHVLWRAMELSSSDSAPPPVRIAAIRLLGTGNFATCGQALLALLGQSQPQAVQLAAVESLDELSAPQIAPELIGHFAAFPPAVRSAAITALLRRPDRTIALLHAIQDGKMRTNDLTTAQANSLRKSRDASVRQMATKLLSAPRPRDQVIAQFQPALTLSGDAGRGHLIYQQRCAQCHHLGSEGFSVGPDLTTIRNDGKAKAMVNILDPNREVAANYVAYLVETRSGESLLGILAAETATGVTVRQPFGKDTVVLRSDIKRIESQQLSLMPEGLEEGLKPQDMADLLEFIFVVH
ncbi:MAG TPA: PVC-type heme-binding CxxCH protein [Tepidisphaeraceae bacterium]|nr:PVC-type heme-binding CxxCH protein [Tepidisphaeraceae bacterium]